VRARRQTLSAIDAVAIIVGILFVLRRKDPAAVRPFRVPLYPLTPALFCVASAYMLWSSVAYTRLGALAGIAVLLVGVVVLLAGGGRESELAAGNRGS